MKTESIFIAFCLAFVPTSKGQKSETPKWLVDRSMSGTYISESDYPAGTSLNFQVQNTGKLSALIVAKAPAGPNNWIGALGPAGQKYSVEFKGTTNLQVTLHEASRIIVYAYAHLSAQENPIGQETDGWILNGDGAPVTAGNRTTFKWEKGVSVTMDVASSASSKSPSSSDSARIAELEKELNKLKGNQGATPPTSNTLTREVAANLLRDAYPRPLQNVCFSPQGIQRAESEGLIVKEQMILITVARFTDKARQIFGSGIPQSVETNERGQMCFNISAPLNELFNEITGVAMGLLPNTASIEYTTRYGASTSTLEKLKPYIFSGNKRTAEAQLYDDGWRLVQH